MDEYIGLQADAPQRFGNYLKEHIFAALPFKSIHYLYIEGASPENICTHYEEVLQSIPSTLFSWESVKTGTSPLMTRMWHCLMIPAGKSGITGRGMSHTTGTRRLFLQSGESTPTGSHHYDTGYDESYPYLLHSTGKAEGECCERNIIRPCQHPLARLLFYVLIPMRRFIVTGTVRHFYPSKNKDHESYPSVPYTKVYF